MRRLTDDQYFRRHNILLALWHFDPSLCGLLPVAQLFAVQLYYSPAGHYSRDEMLRHRAIVEQAAPAIPRQAERPYQVLAAAIRDCYRLYGEQSVLDGTASQQYMATRWIDSIPIELIMEVSQPWFDPDNSTQQLSPKQP